MFRCKGISALFLQRYKTSPQNSESQPELSIRHGSIYEKYRLAAHWYQREMLPPCPGNSKYAYHSFHFLTFSFYRIINLSWWGLDREAKTGFFSSSQQTPSPHREQSAHVLAGRKEQFVYWESKLHLSSTKGLLSAQSSSRCGQGRKHRPASDTVLNYWPTAWQANIIIIASLA